MKGTALTIGVVAAFVVLVLLVNSVYTVQETEQVILTQFGRPVGKPITTAGLHFKRPFVQQVNRLEKRILDWDGAANQIPTLDKLFIHVDTFARWRIADPLLYFQRLKLESNAQSRLDDILDGETRNVITKYELHELIRTSNRQAEQDQTVAQSGAAIGTLRPIQVGREKIAAEILANASKRLTDLGIELLDIRFKRINYNADVQQRIYERMISERMQIASKFQSEGHGEAANIRGERERDLRQIESEAYKKVEEIKGAADARAAEIYAAAYNRSFQAQEFYQFLKTMDTYAATLREDTTLLMSSNADLWRYLKSSGESLSPAVETPFGR